MRLGSEPPVAEKRVEKAIKSIRMITTARVMIKAKRRGKLHLLVHQVDYSIRPEVSRGRK
jgi:hypothetical protein